MAVRAASYLQKGTEKWEIARDPNTPSANDVGPLLNDRDETQAKGEQVRQPSPQFGGEKN
jgi:hypothetical protein